MIEWFLSMGLSKEILEALRLSWPKESDDFTVGKDRLYLDIEMNLESETGQFYYFFDKKNRRLIKQFLLEKRSQVDYICQVVLIKKD